MPDPQLPSELFKRADESPDTGFYTEPRLVTHIDPATIAALTQLYRERLPPGGEILDLMSSWVSHLPNDIEYVRVGGLGMNPVELAQNPRLDDWLVHDLNAEPELPYADASFDAVVNAVSIQYLTQPIEVFAEVRRILRPGGVHIIATSHRMFPTKAIAAWHAFPPEERGKLIRAYFAGANGYEAPEFVDRSPEDADPLWVFIAAKSHVAA